jgi:hypothetical protein
MTERDYDKLNLRMFECDINLPCGPGGDMIGELGSSVTVWRRFSLTTRARLASNTTVEYGIAAIAIIIIIIGAVFAILVTRKRP